MCGRMNVSDNEGVRVLLVSLGMDTWPSRDPRWNIAPTQTLDVVKLGDALELVPMSWGFTLTMPGKSGRLVTRHIQNSRSDKVWSSRMWKRSIEKRRVLVPVNGFYEWKRRNKKPLGAYYIAPAQSDAMFLAGIYREAKDGDDKPEVSVVTTEANAAMSKLHDRMPVILNSHNAAMAWMQDDDRDSLEELMQPAANNVLKFTAVSNYVNKSSNEGPECIEPAEDQTA